MYGATLLGAIPSQSSSTDKSRTGEQGINAEMSNLSEGGVSADSEHCDDGVKDGPPDEKQVPQELSAKPFTRTYAPFPVIIFSHGLGGMRSTYSGICCDLASHGYVVASVEHRSLCLSLSLIQSLI